MSTSKPPAAPKKRVVKSKARTKSSASVKQPAARARTTKRAPSLAVSPEERWRMVAVAAYHNAEKRGFGPAGALDDWLNAEREVDALLGTQQGQS